MQITIAKNKEAFHNIAAWRIVGEILKRQNERTTLNLSTGETTSGIYKAMAEIYAEHSFDTSRVCIFGVDELTNVDRSCFGSRYDILLREVVGPLNIYDENFFMPMTFSEDFSRECKAFEDVIAARGGIDLLVLDIGENGCIGFNQPGTPFNSRAFVGNIDEELDRRVRKEIGAASAFERKGMTLGISNIMQSRKLLLVANGSHKAEIVHKALRGPITEEVPASILQLHPFLEVVLDQEAAALL